MTTNAINSSTAKASAAALTALSTAPRAAYSSYVPKTNGRFGMILLAVAIVHIVLILSITFVLPKKPPARPAQSLDVVLLKQSNEDPPEKADYIAEADQKGGGQIEEKNKPKSRNPGKKPQPGNADVTQAQIIPKAKPEVNKKAVLQTPKKSPKKAVKKKIEAEKKPQSKPRPSLNTDYLSQLKQQIIDLEADLDYETNSYTKRTKHKYLNASTAKALDAEYVRQWTRKIERIGNLNYPEQAKRKKLSGTLILSVTLNPKGKVININIRNSSGHTVLDDAAVRIVKLAAPFAPIPQSVLQNNTALVITRTWLFTQKSNSSGSFQMN